MANSSDIDLTKDLVKLNWSPLKIEERLFSFKSIFNNEIVQVLLFDLNELSLYFFSQMQEQLIESFKEFNPSLEAPIDNIIAHLSENFLTFSQSNDKLFVFDHENKNEQVLKLLMNSKLSGAKFRWEFKFDRLNDKLLRQHVLLPLIYSSAEYQLREQELMRLVQAKDKELDDYKSQGHKLSRKHLATEVFCIETFDKKISKEININCDRPEKYLYTPLAHRINEISIPKYMGDILKPKVIKKADDEPSKQNSAKSSQSESSKTNHLDKANSFSKKESRIKELEDKLKDEEEKTKKIPKKKKLF